MVANVPALTWTFVTHLLQAEGENQCRYIGSDHIGDSLVLYDFDQPVQAEISRPRENLIGRLDKRLPTVTYSSSIFCLFENRKRRSSRELSVMGRLSSDS